MRRSLMLLSFVPLFGSVVFAQEPPRVAPTAAIKAAPDATQSRNVQNPPPPRTPPPGPGQPAAPGAPLPPPAPPIPRKLPTQNVRVDVTITDSFGSGPTKKTIGVLVADGRNGSIRSTMTVPQADPAMPGAPNQPIQHFTYQNISLNVDAAPEVLADGRIFMGLNVQYTPDTPQEPGGSNKPGSLNEALQVVLADGKQTLIAQSADPRGDRKVTLEVTATIVK